MSKKYKGKPCVYCIDNVSTTGDHVFAREFFLEQERDLLVKVPACLECNNLKSRLEHYLSAVLPFGGLHSDAKRNLEENIPARLERNQRLTRELKESLHWISNISLGASKNTFTIPFDGDSYTQLFEYIVKALTWHHWGTYISKGSFAYAVTLTKHGDELISKYIFSLRSKNRVEETIGVNTIRYLGVQSVGNDQLTAWMFEMYNGLSVSGEVVSANSDFSNRIFVFTGPKSQEDSIKKLFF